jgi:F420-dependent oxidoreductase-like protein
MAQQALTTQAACDGRFTLGIGLSHKVMMEDSLGLPFEHPAKHMAEYLAVLAPLLRRESVTFHGNLYSVEATLSVDAAPVPLLVAALGPSMLKLAGRLADGTITSWVGPKALAGHIVPGISAAAREAGRPAPQVVVGLPIELTNDAVGARQRMAQRVEFYNSLPSYRAMLDIEGAEHPAELALLGDESALSAQLARLAEAGATEFQAQLIATEPGSAQRTFEFLASLV